MLQYYCDYIELKRNMVTLEEDSVMGKGGWSQICARTFVDEISG